MTFLNAVNLCIKQKKHPLTIDQNITKTLFVVKAFLITKVDHMLFFLKSRNTRKITRETVQELARKQLYIADYCGANNSFDQTNNSFEKRVCKFSYGVNGALRVSIALTACQRHCVAFYVSIVTQKCHFLYRVIQISILFAVVLQTHKKRYYQFYYFTLLVTFNFGTRLGVNSKTCGSQYALYDKHSSHHYFYQNQRKTVNLALNKPPKRPFCSSLGCNQNGGFISVLGCVHYISYNFNYERDLILDIVQKYNCKKLNVFTTPLLL